MVNCTAVTVKALIGGGNVAYRGRAERCQERVVAAIFDNVLVNSSKPAQQHYWHVVGSCVCLTYVCMLCCELIAKLLAAHNTEAKLHATHLLMPRFWAVDYEYKVQHGLRTGTISLIQARLVEHA